MPEGRLALINPVVYPLQVIFIAADDRQGDYLRRGKTKYLTLNVFEFIVVKTFSYQYISPMSNMKVIYSIKNVYHLCIYA